ncbi:uncharacterized protein [Temnothorax nylanderi]|uniref:uncharacterized protein isoform X2 n=1 Tax=Temnothorax nylanderi TaxID=102681 RepID=UPI003A8C0A47
MAIMQSCCCWQSVPVRKGSYACAIYTLIYFAVLTLTTGTLFSEQIDYYQDYLKGDVVLPVPSNFLEKILLPASIYFGGMQIIYSSCGMLCSLLLLYGLYKDHKMLLIPWIFAVIVCINIHTTYCSYLFAVMIYSLLCVISQYQEYSAGRGTAADNYYCEIEVPAVRYQPTTTTTATTSCPSSRRVITSNEATSIQKPTTSHNFLLSEKSPTGNQASGKHVQFPDTSPIVSQIERPEMSTEIPTRCSPKIKRNANTSLQPSDAITIMVINPSLSNDEYNHIAHEKYGHTRNAVEYNC